MVNDNTFSSMSFEGFSNNDYHNEFCRQCTLFRNGDGNEIILVAWLDDKKIGIGKFIKLKNQNHWWKIIKMSNIRLPKKYVIERGHDYTRTRKTSDI